LSSTQVRPRLLQGCGGVVSCAFCANMRPQLNSGGWTWAQGPMTDRLPSRCQGTRGDTTSRGKRFRRSVRGPPQRPLRPARGFQASAGGRYAVLRADRRALRAVRLVVWRIAGRTAASDQVLDPPGGFALPVPPLLGVLRGVLLQAVDRDLPFSTCSMNPARRARLSHPTSSCTRRRRSPERPASGSPGASGVTSRSPQPPPRGRLGT
jgi:hypothetical protein